jgi:glycerol-3-phosphate acyltransferase PlsX
MRIGIDAMGGDFAPDAIVKGAVLSLNFLPLDVKVVLLGDKDSISAVLKSQSCTSAQIEIIHTSQVIEMGDHPAKAFAQKPDSSIAVGFNMLKAKEIDVFASAGNTGAMMAGTMYTIKAIPGIQRPCIMAPIPRMNYDTPNTVLDVGINSDCKPEVLYQYGILGSLYAANVYGIQNPRVALMNIGEEEGKGNLISKATFELMKDTKEFNFIGNIEGNDLYKGKADVVVCDGFTGNIILKLSESFYNIAVKKNIVDSFFDKFNYENQGGTMVLGVNEPVLIAHGVSNDVAIKNLILQAKNIVETKLVDQIKQAFHND